MSRFLARALALLDAPKPTPPQRPGFGGFGEFGEPAENQAAGPDEYLSRLARRRRKAIEEGRWCWTAPEVLVEMMAARVDPGREGEVSGQRRMTSWGRADIIPAPGDWCSCCGRFERQGGRWWREAAAPTGWRCYICHPPPEALPVIVVVTQGMTGQTS